MLTQSFPHADVDNNLIVTLNLDDSIASQTILNQFVWGYIVNDNFGTTIASGSDTPSLVGGTVANLPISFKSDDTSDGVKVVVTIAITSDQAATNIVELQSCPTGEPFFIHLFNLS